MIELGIAPAFTGKELTEMLSSMSDEERRVSQRKFRKVWRKLLKDNKVKKSSILPVDTCVPDEIHLKNRAFLVTNRIINDIED